MSDTETYKCNVCRGEVVFDAEARSGGACGVPGCNRKGRWIHIGADCGRLGFAYGPYPKEEAVQ